MSKIHAIIFDYGKVILNIDHELTRKAFQNLGIKDIDGHFQNFKQEGFFGDFEKGLITEKVFFSKLIDFFPGSIQSKDVVQAWNKMILDLPKTNLKFLTKIKNHYRLFLMSNANLTHIKLIDKKIKINYGYDNINSFFNKTYYSFDYHLSKPEPEFFKLIVKEQNLKLNNTLFIDDCKENIEAALKLGFKTLHYTATPQNLPKELDYLIKI